MIRAIKIPEDRTGVLIGHAGKTKKTIEKKTGTKIGIGEEVIIEGDALGVITAENIVKAIARGFSPENALGLLDEENVILIIDLPKNAATLKRVRSRLIGAGGKSRHNIEVMTKTKISIYGKTVSIIGTYERAERAARAIRKLIDGVPHKAVYQYLESHKSDKNA